MPNYRAIDVHIHIQPLEMVNPETLKAFGAHHANFEEVKQIVADPAKFLDYLDRIGVEKAVLINYVSPDAMGFTAETNDWVARYSRYAPDRLIPCGSVHPRLTADCAAET